MRHFSSPFLIAATAVLFCAFVGRAGAQSILDSFDPKANGAVSAFVVQPDGKILLCGNFTTLSPNGGATFTRNHFARLNSDGTVDTGFNPIVSGSVYAMALQADGNILVGGLFTSISGQSRSNIARLNSDGTVDPTFNPSATGTNSDVEEIAVQADGKILVGGFFTTIGGQARNYLARLDPTTGLADSFNPNPDNAVTAMAIQADGKVLAGGLFANIGGQARQRLARVDAVTGLADAFNPNPDTTVYSLAVQLDGKILVGGVFHSIGGRRRDIFARLDPVTGLADSLDVAPDSNAQWVMSIAVQPDGRIVLGGEFFKIGFQTRNRFARIDPATNGLADSLAPNANSLINAVALQPDGKILLGGGFTSFAPAGETPVARNRVARLQVVSPTPTATPAPGTCGWTEAPRFPDRISGQAVTSLNGYIYSFGGTSDVTPNCYKFDGTTWTPIAPLPIAKGSVAAANDGTYIYVLRSDASGSPTNPTNSLYRYDPVMDSYTTLAPFATTCSSPGVVYLGGKIYKFGGFTNVGIAISTQEIYDVASNSWTTGANYPMQVAGVAAFTNGSFIFGAGGNLNFGGATTKTYRYNPATNTWDDAAIADLPAARSSAAVAFYNGGAVLASGGTAVSWDPGSDVWSNLPSMLGARSGAAGAVLNESLYVFGGINVSATSDNQRLTCTAAINPSPTPTPTPTATASPAATATATASPTPTATATATPTATATVTPTPTATATPTASPGTVGNVSTRLPVGAGDDALIEGFIVQGPAGSTKKIIVRAIGPSLVPFGITDALSNPTLEIHDTSSLIARNDDWRVTQTGGLIAGDQSGEIAASGVAPSNDAESAIIANLAPGSYTAVVQGAGGGTGTGVVDAYDLSAASPAKLANIATRGLVQPSDKLMIAGFIIQNGPVRAVVRGIGPSLIAFGISNALPDTTLQLRDQNGVVVIENDDWKFRSDGSSQQAEMEATGLQPTNDLEAAFVTTLQPGQYTAQLRGKPETTGIGVVQIYFLQ